DEFLEDLNITDSSKEKVRDALLAPITVNGKTYDNFMVEVGRRMSQSIQPRSGKSAELCAEIALEREGLKRDVHFTVRDERSDLTMHHPNIRKVEKTHRVEVKNLKIRERGVRGLVFDGDSLFGFFDDPGEFTAGNIDVMEKALGKTGGYVYLPPHTLEAITKERLVSPSKALRLNTRFGTDMASFVKSGAIPKT
ncbi:MAG: hypothetical protein ACFFER_14585, partial [Candidatus Thorarchaeota archaeon]